MTDLATDPWSLYADTRDRFIALARSLTPEQAGKTVPLTPGWTIAQVVAHVCGLNADLAAGVREGLGTSERTSLQVERRADHTVEQVCDEWLGHAEAVEAIIGGNGFLGRRLAADLVIHLHDVQHSLGMAIDTEDEATLDAARTYATHTVDRWLESTGSAVVIELSDGSRLEPTRDGRAPMLTLRASNYDFLRSVSGRRSRLQVEALDWSQDPGQLIDHFSPYGMLRKTDAEI